VEENKLKHRLVGATVLVALGVVFLPLWLDMRPGPGTRLEKTNIPARPQWHFFKSEEEEHQAIVPPQPVAAPETPVVANSSAEVPAAAPEPPAPEQPPISAKGPPPPLPSPRPAGVYTTEIKKGTSLYGVFAKADLGADQVRALLKLGPSVKNLETLQPGRNLWLKAGPQKELQELIYYGPGHKIFTHIVCRGKHLQLADSVSAAQALTSQGGAAGERVTPEPSEPPVPPVTQTRRPVTPPVARVVSTKPLASSKEAARYIPPRTAHPPIAVETRRVETPVTPPPAPLAPVVRPPEPSNLATHAPPPHSGTAGAWVVQIASLKREEGARALRDSLRSKGFPAFLESLYEGSNKQWRVRVGPSTERSEVDSLRTRLERDAHLPGQVLPYP